MERAPRSVRRTCSTTEKSLFGSWFCWCLVAFCSCRCSSRPCVAAPRPRQLAKLPRLPRLPRADRFLVSPPDSRRLASRTNCDRIARHIQPRDNFAAECADRDRSITGVMRPGDTVSNSPCVASESPRLRGVVPRSRQGGTRASRFGGSPSYGAPNCSFFGHDACTNGGRCDPRAAVYSRG
jgi:hypothetical protein